MNYHLNSRSNGSCVVANFVDIRESRCDSKRIKLRELGYYKTCICVIRFVKVVFITLNLAKRNECASSSTQFSILSFTQSIYGKQLSYQGNCFVQPTSLDTSPCYIENTEYRVN